MRNCEIERARAKVTALEAELEQARRALAVLEEIAAASPPLEDGAHPRSRQKFVTEIMGVEIEVGAKPAAVIDLLRQLGDDEYAPTSVVRTIFGGTKSNVNSSIKKLRKNLAKTGAEIVFFKGQGYRLQERAA